MGIVMLLDSVWSNLLISAAIAMIAYLLAYLRVRPSLRHSLWVIVLIKLVSPPLLSLTAVTRRIQPHSIATANVPLIWQAASTSENAIPAAYQDERRLLVPAKNWNRVSWHSFTAAISRVTPAWFICCAAVWLTGSVAWFVVAIHRLRSFQKLLRHARQAPLAIVTEVQDIANQFGLRYCPRVLVIDARIPPMVWNFDLQTSIVLPSEWIRHLGAREQSSVLMHEVAHIARGDHWLRWLELLVLGINWWNPVAWWAVRELQQAEDECCDAWVLWARPAIACSYAETLLNALDFVSASSTITGTSVTAFTRHRRIARRIANVLKPASPHRLSWKLRAIVLLLWVGIVPLSLFAQPNPAGSPGEAGGTSRDGVHPTSVTVADFASRSQTERRKLLRTIIEANRQELQHLTALEHQFLRKVEFDPFTRRIEMERLKNRVGEHIVEVAEPQFLMLVRDGDSSYVKNWTLTKPPRAQEDEIIVESFYDAKTSTVRTLATIKSLNAMTKCQGVVTRDKLMLPAEGFVATYGGALAPGMTAVTDWLIQGPEEAEVTPLSDGSHQIEVAFSFNLWGKRIKSRGVARFDLSRGGMLSSYSGEDIRLTDESLRGTIELVVDDAMKLKHAWIPTQARVFAWSSNPKVANTVTIHEYKVTEIRALEAGHSLALPFPPGTLVNNELTGRSYEVPVSGEEKSSTGD